VLDDEASAGSYGPVGMVKFASLGWFADRARHPGLPSFHGTAFALARA